ncbi:MAG: hypothetical protein IJP29_02240 [Lachnospiraceae bacterium]|nr:hypothetical protein [Lachnospiraceae bacterium]
MYHFIMNPMASSGKGLEAWKQIEEILKREHVEYEAHVLCSAKETTDFVKRLTDKATSEYIDDNANIKESSDSVELEAETVFQVAATAEDVVGEGKVCHIVVVGGDGTINAVLNGIVDFEHTILSCLRTGSGNDFARNQKVDKNVRKALHHLLRHPEMCTLDYGVIHYETDTGSVNQRFAISSGVGYDADICEEVGHSRLKKALNKVGLGKLVYVMIGVKQIFTRKNSGAILYIDEEKLQLPSLFFVVGMIHEMEGGGVPFCPQANPSDGLLDVCLVRGMSKLKLLMAVFMVYMKKHYKFRAITAHRCRQLRVEFAESQWFHCDGDTSIKVKHIAMECRTGLHFCK